MTTRGHTANTAVPREDQGFMEQYSSVYAAWELLKIQTREEQENKKQQQKHPQNPNNFEVLDYLGRRGLELI